MFVKKFHLQLSHSHSVFLFSIVCSTYEPEFNAVGMFNRWPGFSVIFSVFKPDFNIIFGDETSRKRRMFLDILNTILDFDRLFCTHLCQEGISILKQEATRRLCKRI